MTKLVPLAIALAGALVAPGCGYHVGGHGDLMPKTIKTIAIPAFGNVTVRYQLARLLPADITREFISRTHYTIVADPNQADAVLGRHGGQLRLLPHRVRSCLRPRHRRASRGHPASHPDRPRHRKVLFSRIGAEFRERYEISVDPAAYFDESGTAMERVSRDVARSVVDRHSGGLLVVVDVMWPGRPAMTLPSSSRMKKGPAPAAVLLLGPEAYQRLRLKEALCRALFPKAPSREHDLSRDGARRNSRRRPRALAVRRRASHLGAQRRGRPAARPLRRGRRRRGLRRQRLPTARWPRT